MDIQENKSFFSKSNIIVIAIALLLGLIIGILVLGIYFNHNFNQFQSQLTQSKAQASKSSVASLLDASKEQFVGGTIEKIDGNILTLNSISKKKTYTVKVTSNTKIIKREFSKDAPIKDTNASLSDLKVKDSVSVGTFENISGKTEFAADDIFLQIFNASSTQIAPK